MNSNDCTDPTTTCTPQGTPRNFGQNGAKNLLPYRYHAKVAIGVRKISQSLKRGGIGQVTIEDQIDQ